MAARACLASFETVAAKRVASRECCDSRMTLDVYTQLQQRIERQYGEGFDELVRQVRERLYGTFERADADDEDAEEDERRPEDLVDERRDKDDGAQPDRIPLRQWHRGVPRTHKATL